MPETRRGVQVRSDTVKGEFPSGRESCSVPRGEGWGESLGRDTESVHFIPAAPEQQRLVGGQAASLG